MRFRLLTIFALYLSTMTMGAQAQSVVAASSQLQNSKGEHVGTVTARETKNAGVWLYVSIDKLPRGVHAFHIHETGKCAGDFKSAGGHYAPGDHKHGVLVDGGKHAGDLPNIHVPKSGRLIVEIFAPGVTLEKGVEGTLFDDDGSAIVVHEGLDDYKSQPSGAAGSRIACGVITNKTIAKTPG